MVGKIAAAGIIWFNREDYPRILEIMKDAHVLPPTYELWREKAENDERRAQAAGLRVVRAVIDPQKFIAWCATNGLDIDAKARTAFAADFAMGKVLN